MVVNKASSGCPAPNSIHKPNLYLGLPPIKRANLKSSVAFWGILSEAHTAFWWVL